MMKERIKDWDETEKMECIQLFDAVTSVMKPHSDEIRENVVVNLAANLILDAADSSQEVLELLAELSCQIGEAVLVNVEIDPSFETVGELLKRARPQ